MTDAAGWRPLAGRRVLVTRPREQASELVLRLERAGASAIVAPAIRIVPPADREPLLRAARMVSSFDWIVFASVNAVDALADAMSETGTRLSPDTRVCAVGSRTAMRLREKGLAVSLVPSEFRAESLVAAITEYAPLSGVRVLLPRSEIGRDTIAEGLRAAGAQLTDVVAYRTVAEASGLDVKGMIADGTIDAITFTSGSAVRNFVQLHGTAVTQVLRQTIVAAIGPVTGDAARDLGIRVDVQPAVYTIDAMVDALERRFAGSSDHEPPQR